MTRPNILILMSDEHRADVAGYAGNSIVRTPVLDQLASTGAVFRNAYAPSPICIPSRQCMMAGQFPKTAGCESYGKDLPPGHMTFARLFSQYGYATIACGKLHHMGIDQMQGWTRRIGDDCEVASNFIKDRNEEECLKASRPLSEMKWSQQKEIKRAGIGRAPHVVKDAYTVQGALNFIDDFFVNPHYDRETPKQPLLLKVSLLQPHYPYMADESKFRYYLNRVQPYTNQKVFDHPFLSRFKLLPEDDVSEREIRRAVAAYYAMIETVDDHFGTIIDALEAVGQNLDEWIIIYTSDHGEMLGEHGVWEKQKFFEGSAKVPLILRWPSRISSGITVDENVSLCDIFATLCELADLQVPSGLDSRSLAPLLTEHPRIWENEVVSQFGGSNLMIKRDHLKYQYYGSDMPEVLFDLQENPQETVNFIYDPQYVDVISQFRKRTQELGFGSFDRGGEER